MVGAGIEALGEEPNLFADGYGPRDGGGCEERKRAEPFKSRKF
jgi:hypothetical protein